MIAFIITVILHSDHRYTTRAAFTFVEALVAVSLIGIGVATSLTALLKSQFHCLYGTKRHRRANLCPERDR